MWAVALPGMGAIAAEATVVIYASEELGRGDVVTGVLATAVPFGTIAATALVPFKGSHRHLLRMGGVVGTGSALAAAGGFWLLPGLPFVFLAFLAVGVVFATAVPANIVAGLRTPNEVRASTFGVLTGVWYGSEGIGAALGGVLARSHGVRHAVILCLAASALASWVAYLVVPADHSRRLTGRRRRAPA